MEAQMIGEGLLILALGAIACALIAGAGRGLRIPGPSWFDIQHETGRAARRRNR
jgi:hypothetical protein